VSNALAIAAVTAVLKDLLNNGLIDQDLSATLGTTVTVTALAPDRIDLDKLTGSQLNLFLWQVTPNQGWRNAGQPERDGNGRRLNNPPLALDLHYLLTAYGKEEYHAEILLGYAMQLLHQTSVLTRDAVRKTLGPPSPPALGANILPKSMQALSAAALADQVELIKITPQTLSTEEISRLWAAFQVHYRPTAAYQASVVLIETDRPTKSAPPVRRRNVYALPFRQPFIDRVEDAAGPQQPIATGSTLAIIGQQLRAPETRVLVGAAEALPETGSTDTRLLVKLGSLPATVRAGVQPVQVVQPVRMGQPALPHRGFESNVAALVLRPTVTATLPAAATTDDSGATYKGTVRVQLTPRIGKEQSLQLLLDELPAAADGAGQAYVFPGPPNNGIKPPSIATDTATVDVPFDGVAPGNYLVRVRVDGAESLLDVDSHPNSPTFGLYIGTPKVKIP
jgi:hypothetical protein